MTLKFVHPARVTLRCPVCASESEQTMEGSRLQQTYCTPCGVPMRVVAVAVGVPGPRVRPVISRGPDAERGAPDSVGEAHQLAVV